MKEIAKGTSGLLAILITYLCMQYSQKLFPNSDSYSNGNANQNSNHYTYPNPNAHSYTQIHPHTRAPTVL
jgi:hypothetical protein